jgi:hypothetical protein
MVNFIIASILFMTNPNIGFGIGQTLGEHLLTPSLFTMRIRVGEFFVIAPEMNIKYSSHEAEIDSIKDSDLTFGIESNFHYAFIKRNRTGFYGIFGVGGELSKEISEWYEREYVHPDSFDVYEVKVTTTTNSYGVNLGLGMEQFLTNNLSIFISSVSNITLEDIKRDKKEKGEKQTIFKNSGYTFDFQNLRCCIYLVWYL